MRRLLILTVFITAAFAQSANAAQLITDLRPANPVELQSMNGAIAAEFKSLTFTLTSADVSPGLGLGVASVDFKPSLRKAVFEVRSDGTVVYGGITTLPPSCESTRGLLLYDVTAERLGLVPEDSCSLGKPAHLPDAQLARIGRLRAAANRGIDKFSKTANRCKTFNCLVRARNRHYKRPISKLISGAKKSKTKVSWSDCLDKLDELETAVTAHREGVEQLIFFNFIRSRSDIKKAQRAINKAARNSRAAWNGIKKHCTYYPPI